MKYAARFLIATLATSVMACAWNSTLAQADTPDEGIGPMTTKVWRATALLYAKDRSGTFDMKCTVTAFERDVKDPDVYRFATASHCVAEDDEAKERVELDSDFLRISLDEPDKDEVMYRAKVLAAGYQNRGDDFAVLEARMPGINIVVIPLADNDPGLGETLINIASPAGYGKQFFFGHVSSPRLDRPIVTKESSINWMNAVLVQMNIGGGSSGSSLVSVKQKGIVAFLVGMMKTSGTVTSVALPVSRFKAFWSASKAGKYKWFKPEPEETKKK